MRRPSELAVLIFGLIAICCAVLILNEIVR